MHYDKKISLALGILLVGIVGAFFFRNDHSQSADIPRLKDAKSLDEQIAQKSIRPYDAPSRLEGVIEEPPSQTPNVPRESAFPYEELPPHGPRAATSSRSPSDAQQRAKPIETSRGRQTARGRALPVSRNNSRNNGQGNTVSRRPGNGGTREGQGQAYRVQPGDTLSGLALRFLGSSSRFREIFNANKDQLRDPDDLRPGITLRIPTRRKRTKTFTVQATRQKPLKSARKDATNRSDKTGASGGRSSGQSRGQFVPVGRSPVFQGRFPIRSSRNTKRKKRPETKKKRRRRLEQKPPRGISRN